MDIAHHVNVRTLLCVAAGVGLLAVPAGTQPRANASSAAGGYIVYSDKPRAGSSVELLRIRPDGSGRRRLTWNGRWDGSADASRDGSRIVFEHNMVSFASGSYSSENGVSIVTPDGRELREVDVGGEEWPRWSPDGTQIASQEQCSYSGSGPDGTCFTLFVALPDGSGRRSVSGVSSTGNSRDSVSNGTGWSWAPDGRAIAYERPRREGSDSLAVVLANIETGSARLVTTGAEPAFAPHAQLLAVARPGGIAVVGVDGRFVRWASRTPRGRYDASPSWSPDGRRIGFWRLDAAGDAHPALLVVDLRTSVSRTYAGRKAYWTSRIVWSPDSRYVLVSDDAGGETSWMYRIDLNRKSAPVRVARGYAWDWAPGGG